MGGIEMARPASYAPAATGAATSPAGSSSTRCGGPAAGHAAAYDAADPALQAIERKVHWHILPPMAALVIVSYIDRTNLAFASVQMNAQLGLSATTYGLGGGLFYLFYGAFQLPSNWMLVSGPTWLRGGPRWLGTIAIVWGLLASCFAFVSGPGSFLALRMALGAAEAGAFPGMWYFTSIWYPSDRATLPFAVIETGITVSQICGAFFAAGLLSLDGRLGLAGWQWVFLVEGLPAVALGVYMMTCLPRDPASAPFLSPGERTHLAAAIAASHVSSRHGQPGTGGGVAAAAAGASPRSAAGVGSASSAGSSMRGHSPVGALVRSCSGSSAAGSREGSPARLRRQGRAPASHSPAGEDEHEGAQQQQQQRAEQEQGRQRPDAPLLAPAQQRSSPMPAGGSPPRVGPHAGGGASDGDGAASVSWAVLGQVARSPVVVYPGLWRVLHDLGGYALIMFTPLIIHGLLAGDMAQQPAGGGGGEGPGAAPLAPAACPGWAGGSKHGSGAETGARTVLLTAIPFGCASVVHLLNCMHSQRTGERRWHIAAPWLVGALAMMMLPLAWGVPAAAFALLVVCNVGSNGANAVQTSWLVSLLEGPHRALGLPMYNTVGNAGALLGPYLTGALYDATCSYSAAMLLLGALLAGAAAMVLGFGAERWLGRELALPAWCGGRGGRSDAGWGAQQAGGGKAGAHGPPAAAGGDYQRLALPGLPSVQLDEEHG